MYAQAQMILSPTPIGLMALLATLPNQVIFTTQNLTRLLSSTPVGLEIIRFCLNVLVWPQPCLNHHLGHPQVNDFLQACAKQSLAQVLSVGYLYLYPQVFALSKSIPVPVRNLVLKIPVIHKYFCTGTCEVAGTYVLPAGTCR